MTRLISSSDLVVQYDDVTSQHWHPDSERFAGADNLVTALEYGWEITRCALTHHHYAGMRSVKVYRFTLQRKGQTMQMPVLGNPYVFRFIAEEQIELETPAEAKVN